MNREERRKVARAGVDHRALKRMEEDAKKQAVNATTSFVVASALLVLRDQFGFGEKRAKKFISHFAEVFADVSDGRLSLGDVLRQIEAELNISLGE